MKWYKLLLLSLLSGLLLAFSWYPHGLPFLIFFALVPLFIMSDRLLEKGSKVPFWKGFIFSYPGFLLWNGITTYWICYTTVPGAVGASVLNAMLEALVFAFWHCCRKQIKQRWAHPILFVAFWISFEYLHLSSWDLTWPWLNIGNVFATCPRFIQWYSVTGALGGTLWALVANFLMWWTLSYQREYKARAWKQLGAFIGWIALPIIISAFMYAGYEKKIEHDTPIKAVVVQPNTDVWEEQFGLTNYQQMQRILALSEPYLNDSTNLLVCPESCLAHSVYLKQMRQNIWPAVPQYAGFKVLDSIIQLHPNLNYILGLSTFETYDHPATPTAQEGGPNIYLDLFNTAMCFNKDGYNGHYHKSRLVPGVEAMPFPKLLGFLSQLMVDLGGSHGSLGKDSVRRVFTIDVNGQKVKTSTAICYESIYGELVSRFVKNGSNVLTIITNDSWWNDTPGHKQHFEMARLRAIENRRYVLRAANGGFSGIIDPRGNVLHKTGYLERAIVGETVYAQQHLTFYSKHGDYLAWIAIVLAAIGFLFAFEEWLRGIFIQIKNR